MKTRPEIEAIATRVAQRHNSLLVRSLVVLAVLIVSAVIIAAALFWVPRGYSVPWIVPAVIVLLGAIATTALFMVKRMTTSSALPEADRHFALKDGLTSADHLARTAPDETTTRLQWEWLSPRLTACDPATINRPFPKKSSAGAIALAAIALTLCVLPPSDSIRAAEIAAEETRSRVAESKQQLEELIDELEEDIAADEEKENLDMNEFREMVKALDETGDRTEAARQFARIEQKIREATRALDQQRDEETLKLAATELAKSEDTDARKLGKKLDEKELKEAAELLDKLAAKPINPKALKKSAAEKKKVLDEAKKELAKMRAASKRLAAAGKQRQAARQAQGANAPANAKPGADGNATQSDGQGTPLEDMLAELDDAAATMEENLEELEFDPDAELCQGSCDKMGQMKGKIGKHLKKMQGKRMARSKLDALRQGLAQAQGFCQGNQPGQGQSLQLAGQQPGGQKPGVGSSWSERQERDDSQKNGALAQLNGQHGEGPSLSAVEDAESGTGVSNRRGTAKERDYNRQMESFVQRDDIPESLKLGVRNYFENLQSATKE